MSALESPVQLELDVASRPLAAELVGLLRPRQWAKNVLAVPLALIDAPIWTAGAVARTAWAVFTFIAASSLVYVLNDIADRHLDRRHPGKRGRPIASGRVSVPAALGLGGALALVMVAMVLLGPGVPWWPLAAYLAVNLTYSRRLKHVPLVDICVVAAGFVLRVLHGYGATGGPVSVALLCAVFTGCLVLVVGKRRHELELSGAVARPALAGYNLPLTDHLLGLNITLTAGAFLLYLDGEAPVDPLRPLVLLVAAPAGLFAAFRYLQSVLVHRQGGDPVRAVLRDRLILTSGAVVGLVLAVALAGNHYPHLLNWTNS
jgi:decaprenyl-phosphate phosphoribosyltransferase